MSEPPAPPAGAPPRRDVAKFIVIGIGAVLTATIIGIVVLSTRTGPADIRHRVLTVQSLSDSEIAVTIEVEKAPLASAECDISAFDEKGSSMGRLVGVPIGPNTRNQRVTVISVSVPTTLGAAVDASVAGCRITRTR